MILVEARVFRDDRGQFLETYKKSDFAKHGISQDFHQDNHSKSAKGVLRGLHYQIEPNPQGKLVRCIAGDVFDVAVDIRRGSPTYGKWVGATLTAAHAHMLWVPAGFAHAFQALTDGAEVLYKTTGEYSPAHERSIRWDDPAIGIEWPLPKPHLHPKDASAPLLDDAENNFRWQP